MDEIERSERAAMETRPIKLDGDGDDDETAPTSDGTDGANASKKKLKRAGHGRPGVCDCGNEFCKGHYTCGIWCGECGQTWEPGHYCLRLLKWPHSAHADCVCQDTHLHNLDFEDFASYFSEECGLDDDELREYHSGLWKHVDIAGHHWGCDDDGDDQSFVHEYDQYTLEVLKELVRQRGSPDLQSKRYKTLKYAYVRELRRADKDWTFRFMDLPPELRVHVCRMLFSFGYVKERTFGDTDDVEALLEERREVPSEPAQHMDTAILRTCRQIHDEAKEILYSEFVPSMFFMVQGWDLGLLLKEIHVHNTTQNFFGDHGKFYCLPQALDDYPDYLRHVHRLELRLRYEFCFHYGDKFLPSDGWPAINRFLFGLASFLAEGHSLKYLTIKIDFPAETQFIAAMTRDAVRECLYPLRRIRNVANVSFEGEIPGHIISKLKADMSSSEPAFNTMRHWKLLNDEATAQLGLLEEMGMAGCDCGCMEPSARAERIITHLDGLTRAKAECVFSSVHEENFIARLGKLKYILEQVDIEDLQAQLEVLSRKRKAREEHEAETDDGRLEEAVEVWGDDIYKHGAIARKACHDWSSDDEGEAGDTAKGQSAVDERELLDKDEISASMEESEPDAASQLSDASASSNSEHDDSACPSP